MTVVNSMIDVVKSNVEADMGKKEQVTAYIEYAPDYKRKEICSQIFWREDGEQPKKEFIARKGDRVYVPQIPPGPPKLID